MPLYWCKLLLSFYWIKLNTFQLPFFVHLLIKEWSEQRNDDSKAANVGALIVIDLIDSVAISIIFLKTIFNKELGQAKFIFKLIFCWELHELEIPFFHWYFFFVYKEPFLKYKFIVIKFFFCITNYIKFIINHFPPVRDFWKFCKIFTFNFKIIETYKSLKSII